MNKYQIIIEETLRRIVEVEEETPVLAVSRAEDEYNEQKYVLSADDFIGADIALSVDDETVKRALKDRAFTEYVENASRSTRSSYPSKIKSGWRSGVSTTPCMSLTNTKRNWHGTVPRSTCCTRAIPGAAALPWNLSPRSPRSRHDGVSASQKEGVRPDRR